MLSWSKKRVSMLLIFNLGSPRYFQIWLACLRPILVHLLLGEVVLKKLWFVSCYNAIQELRVLHILCNPILTRLCKFFYPSVNNFSMMWKLCKSSVGIKRPASSLVPRVSRINRINNQQFFESISSTHFTFSYCK